MINLCEHRFLVTTWHLMKNVSLRDQGQTVAGNLMLRLTEVGVLPVTPQDSAVTTIAELTGPTGAEKAHFIHNTVTALVQQLEVS